MLLLSPDHLDAMRSHAEATYPQECCGLLLGTLATTAPARQVVQVMAMANAWSDAVGLELAAAFSSDCPETNSLPRAATGHSKGDRFWIDPKDMLQAQRQARDLGLAIVGVYHSHPDHPAVPSECDRAIAWSDYSYVIVAVHQGHTTDLQSWALDEHRQFQAERMGVPSPLLFPPQPTS